MKKKQIAESVQEQKNTEISQVKVAMPQEGGSLRSKPLYALQILVITHAIMRERS